MNSYSIAAIVMGLTAVASAFVAIFVLKDRRRLNDSEVFSILAFVFGLGALILLAAGTLSGDGERRPNTDLHHEHVEEP